MIFMQISLVVLVWEEELHTHTYTRNLVSASFSIRVTLDPKPATQVLISRQPNNYITTLRGMLGLGLAIGQIPRSTERRFLVLYASFYYRFGS